MAENSTNITLQVEGMDCANCALGITKNLQKKGLENVYVDFATGEATFLLDDKSKLQSIIDSINGLGYKVVDSKYREENAGKLSTLDKRFYFTLPFTIILFFSHMIFSHDFILNNPFIQLLLCIPVFIIGIIQFGKSAWGSLKTGVPNMDVLIFIGSSAAFFYSLAGIYMYHGTHEVHNYLFFETTSTIISLVLLGNVLEHRSVKQTTTAIQELSAIQVTKAKIVNMEMGKEVVTEIDYKNIAIGSILQVNTGDKIPVDGEVISGEASVDESMLTGESIPVEKVIAHKVIGGTIVVKGNLRMRAESVGENTVLAKIIELVKKAQQAKPSIQKLGDKISAIFVPVVLGISILTFLISHFGFQISIKDSMMSSIAVLVISCPCAMGLATPTAVMVGIGRAAKKGILIKGGSTLEEFAKIKNIVFDKTGTLTTGDFKIKKIECFEGVVEKEVKEILFHLEQYSSHPIAKSIVSELKGKVDQKTFLSVNEEKGIGISARDEQNNFYQIGSYKIAATRTSDDSHTIYILKNRELIATIDLEDAIKKNAKETIDALHKHGITTIMLSGDTKNKCFDLAKKISIDNVYSQQLPQQKLDVINQLNAQALTAMVGDGVNDAPALAKASVGISLSNATQVAIQSAQIILLKNNDLSSIHEAYLISKHTLITIKQNLFWAFFYNIIAIPIAAFGLLNPMVGALAMAFSDVIVIGNSIRLKTKKLK
ncbi:MAG: ATPase P [Bacteroidetes bacterium RIFCSPLOWO2_12_FULL_35_15]|nr:MAG: ATPase P [Bacteroidetes bacterium RIFCSPLOWO2_12_FULL_35_15]